MAAHTETSLGSICVYEGTRRLDNDKGDGIAPTAKAALLRKHQDLASPDCGTLVLTTSNGPIWVMQPHLMQLYSIQIAP